MIFLDGKAAHVIKQEAMSTIAAIKPVHLIQRISFRLKKPQDTYYINN